MYCFRLQNVPLFFRMYSFRLDTVLYMLHIWCNRIKVVSATGWYVQPCLLHTNRPIQKDLWSGLALVAVGPNVKHFLGAPSHALPLPPEWAEAARHLPLRGNFKPRIQEQVGSAGSSCSYLAYQLNVAPLQERGSIWPNWSKCPKAGSACVLTNTNSSKPDSHSLITC